MCAVPKTPDERKHDPMNTGQHESDGATRLAYILGVPLAEDVVRHWPQMGEIVRTSQLVADTQLRRPALATAQRSLSWVLRGLIAEPRAVV